MKNKQSHRKDFVSFKKTTQGPYYADIVLSKKRFAPIRTQTGDGTLKIITGDTLNEMKKYLKEGIVEKDLFYLNNQDEKITLKPSDEFIIYRFTFYEKTVKRITGPIKFTEKSLLETSRDLG